MKRPRKKKSIKAVLRKDEIQLSMKGMSLLDLIPEKPRKKKSSPLQEESNDRFSEATRYAVHQMKNPVSKAAYKTGITANKRTAYLVALTDYMSAPKIIYINTEKYSGNAGDVILVKATDDFKVVSVSVSILVSGKILERGHASPYPRKPKLWRYVVTASNINLPATTVCAKAEDKPGNKTELRCGVGKKS
jgi:hypothetical protein